MPSDIKQYRVFIASPGGLDDEREAFRDALHEYNQIDGHERGILFVPVGWEVIRRGAGRPQSVINQELRQCDYMILVLWDSWGSPPGDTSSQYSSGSEEEYFVALEALADPEMPMSDVVIFFRGIGHRRLSDPGHDLTKVLRFRASLENDGDQFFGTFDDVSTFQRHIRQHLAHWVRVHEGLASEPQPSNLDHETRLASPAIFESETLDTSQDVVENARLVEARRLAREGQLTDAERIFAEEITRVGDSSTFRSYGDFLLQEDRPTQATEMYKRAISRAEREGDASSKTGQAYAALGVAQMELRNIELAAEAFQEATDIFEKNGNQHDAATGYANLGTVAFLGHDPNRAQELLEKSIEIMRSIGREDDVAGPLMNLGKVEASLGNLEKGVELQQEAYEMFSSFGEKENVQVSAHELATRYASMGAFEQAESLFQEALELSRELGHRNATSASLDGLGGTYYSQGKLDLAEETQKEAIEINRELGHDDQVAMAHARLGTVYAADGELERAQSALLEAAEIYGRLRMEAQVADMETRLGELYSLQDDLDRAEEHQKAALQIFTRVNDKKASASTYLELGLISRTRRDHAAAKVFFERGLAAAQQVESKFDIVKARVCLGATYHDLGDKTEAARQWSLGLPLSIEIGDDHNVAQLRSLLAGLDGRVRPDEED